MHFSNTVLVGFPPREYSYGNCARERRGGSNNIIEPLDYLLLLYTTKNQPHTYCPLVMLHVYTLGIQQSLPDYLNTHSTGFPGKSCLKVVESEMSGTTALLVHWSGSWPAWMASVAKWGKCSPTTSLSPPLIRFSTRVLFRSGAADMINPSFPTATTNTKTLPGI